MLYWLGFIIIVSIGLALNSYKKEQGKHEINEARDELAKGKVIYHSSEGGSSSSS